MKAGCRYISKLLGDQEIGKWLEMEQNAGWLLLVDDISDAVNIRKYLPKLNNDRFLDTTSDQKLGVPEQEIILNRLNVAEESMAIIIFLIRLVSGNGFKKIAIELELRDMKN